MLLHSQFLYLLQKHLLNGHTVLPILSFFCSTFKSCSTSSGTFLNFFNILYHIILCNILFCYSKYNANKYITDNCVLYPFCSSNSNFWPCPSIYHIITFSCNRTSYHIYYRKHSNTLFFCFSQCCKCICCFSRLTYYNTQVIFFEV